MSVEAYRKLVDDICLKSGIPDSASMYAETNLQVMSIDFSMYHCVEPSPDLAVLYGDFGPLPTEAREAVLLRLMQLNLQIHNGQSPIFSCNPDNNHVLIVMMLPIFAVTADAVLHLLVSMADMALTWRNGYFLNEEEQSGAVAAGGVLEASQSTLNRFSSQFSKSKNSVVQTK